MRARPSTVGIVAAISMILFTATAVVITAPMQGCSLIQGTATPQRVYFEAQEVFIVLVTNAIQAKQDERISQSDWDTVWLPAIDQGTDLLDDMELAYQSGDAEGFNFAKAGLNAVAAILRGAE